MSYTFATKSYTTRQLWEILQDFKTLPPTDWSKEFTEEIKHELRVRRDHDKIANSHGRLVKEYGIDGYVVLQALRADLGPNDEDRAEEDFMAHWYIPNTCGCLYDCTGKAFTCWYRLVYRQNRWWAYHSVAFDV